jgi:UDP-N-acetylmuramoylalanine--D-glutamate ligase
MPVYPSENSLKKNFEMTRQVARYLKIPEKIISKAVENFRGLEHRLEFVKKIPVTTAYHDHASAIYFYNDSAATNPEAASAAIRTFRAPLILIAGGKDKGLDYSPLGETILASRNTQMAVLFGENRGKIRAAIMHEFRNSKKTVAAPHLVLANDLPEAIRIAYPFAKSATSNGYWLNAVILFSPASASFDQFKDYAERGKEFKKIVNRLK